MSLRIAAFFLVLGWVSLPGCSTENSAHCDGWSELAKGEVTATITSSGIDSQVDGAWSADGATWLPQASEIQINVDRSGGWSVVLHALWDVDGTPVTEKVEAGEFPIQVELRERDESGGEAFVYAASGETFWTGEQGGGTLIIAGVGEGEDTLVGCFELDGWVVGSSESQTVTVEQGFFHLRKFTNS